ncbi:MAG TPA: SRPBCC family protein [Thermoanaerobaculia bacterium]|nr:SRPBCC family protein [Thermoanaerobaculia bacterium]
MKLHEVRSIEITAPLSHVFDFIADPMNLPRWAAAFEQVSPDRARLRTPDGAIDIRLRVDASRSQGTVDWTMTFADGSVARAMSRVTPLDASRVVYSFILNAPPVPLEQLEGTLARQVRTLEGELRELKRVVEAEHG